MKVDKTDETGILLVTKQPPFPEGNRHTLIEKRKMKMSMYHAEMLIKNNVVNLGDYNSEDSQAIGKAWRRALVVADVPPTKVLTWPIGTQEPHWWAEIKLGISLEKRAATLRGNLRKKTNTEEDLKVFKAELKETDAQLKKFKKKSKKKSDVVVEKTNSSRQRKST